MTGAGVQRDNATPRTTRIPTPTPTTSHNQEQAEPPTPSRIFAQFGWKRLAEKGLTMPWTKIVGALLVLFPVIGGLAWMLADDWRTALKLVGVVLAGLAVAAIITLGLYLIVTPM